MGSSVHAEGSYKHLTPGNPDFKKGASSVFSHQGVSSKAPLAGGEVTAFISGGAKGNKERVSFSLPHPSFASSRPSSSRFLSPRASDFGVSLSLNHSADRRVRQVELARDVSGWVLLQKQREMGRKSKHITGC